MKTGKKTYLLKTVFQHLSNFWYNRRLPYKGAAVISIPVTCLVTSLIVFAYLQQQVTEAQYWVEHTYEVRQQTNRIFNLLLNSETAVRGYALTKQQKFLEPYKQSFTQISPAVDRLANLVSDNPSQLERHQKLKKLIEQRKTVLNSNFKLLVSNAQTQKEAIILPGFSQGKYLMDTIREELAIFNQVEEKLLVERKQRLENLERLAMGVIWVAGIIGVAGGFTANYLYSLGIVNRVKQLQDNAKRLAEEQPLIGFIPGRDEISKLDKTLHSTAEQIARREAQLREANLIIAEAAKKEKALIENSLDVICSVNTAGKFAEISPACIKLWGYKAEELIGSDFSELVAPEYREKTQEILAQVLSGKEAIGLENSCVRKDGTLIDMVWSAVWSETEQLIFCVGRDNTERKEIERLKDEFISTVNHELRTPLTSLRGFSELLLKREYTIEKQRQYLTIIYDESKRLNNLIDDFLDIQRMESGKQNYVFEALNILTLIRESVALFAHNTNQHKLNVNAPLFVSPVKGDSDRIRQILSNLISNAIKYSPNGGEVNISVAERETEVVVTVADRGMGIPPEAQDKLFTKFYRVDNASTRKIGGTGLGLAIVKEIVEAHGGHIWLESVVGEGSKFYFSLPKAVQKSVSLESEEATTIDVLILEDDAAFSQLLKDSLEEIGFSVVISTFADRGLEILRKNLPRLIFLDILLPGKLDGWDFLIAIKSTRHLISVPVWIVTITEPNIRGLALRGADYLAKPIAPDLLLQMVKYYLPQPSGKSILIADDDKNSRQQIQEYLSAIPNLDFCEATNGKEALEKIKQQMPDLLILDLLMPEVDGFEVLRQLRTNKQALNLPVLVVTGAQLSPEEKAYIQRRMATLVEKQDASLEALTKIVQETLS
ncbi:response regulator [Aerosakkonemataceae cyanobacterium BLCC-F50]|uniref:histidine kinase n=1 Tax=Floridaenema flaviceps BLCC-F50 TaxID=3153642 RepID=A0ABV4XM16_9CYAN